MIVCETVNTQCQHLNLWINILQVWILELVIMGIIIYSVYSEDYSFIYHTHFMSFMYLESPHEKPLKLLSLES